MAIQGVQLALAAAILAVGATLQGAIGFGLALVSAPLLALIDARLVPGPIIFCAAGLTIAMAVRERKAIDLGGVSWAFVGRLPGTAAGAVLLVLLTPKTMGLVFGGLVLLAVFLSAVGAEVRINRWTLLAAGTLSGVMGTTTAIGGPPVAMLYSRSSGPRMRGTLAGYFTLGAALSIATLVAIGRFGWNELFWALSMLPGALIGFVVSGRIKSRLDSGYTRPAVLLVAGIGGLGVIMKQLV